MGCEEWDERERDRVVRVKKKEKEEGKRGKTRGGMRGLIEL